MEVKEPAAKYYPKMSPAEYLEWERRQEYKNEYYSGEIVAMSGASISHNRIQTNLLVAIGNHLAGKSCSVFSSDLRVEVKSKESYFYPDLTIVCGDINIVGNNDDMIDNPAVIIEILSPSTEQYDIRRKKFFYMQMPSLMEYIMIDSKSISCDIIRKTTDSKWENELIADPADILKIKTIDFQMMLSSVYEKVKL